MKRLCCNKLFAFILFLHTFLWANTQQPSVAFYYGNDISAPYIESFDWVVVDADQIDPIWVRRYPEKLFAYVSVGEYERWRDKTDKKHKWLRHENKNWNSRVVDIADENYQNYLLAQMRKLHEQGYRNFFLDTLDAVFGGNLSSKERTRQKEGLATLLKKMRTTFPKSKLIANRGVEVMETLCKTVDAFAVESLYKGIDATSKAYIDVPQKDREWIKAQLEHAKSCGLVPIVIDYLPQSEQTKRRKTAQKIFHEGCVPFIGDRFLQHYGEGVLKPVKREVLLLYDSSALKDGDKVYANVHLLSSMPLEYLGYIPVLKDIAHTLPEAGIERYAGVVVWANRNMDDKNFFEWVQKLVDSGQKVIFLNSFGFSMNAQRAEKLGFSYQKTTPSKNLFAKTTYKSDIVGNELPPMVASTDYLIRAKEAKEILLQAQNDTNQSFDAGAIMPWGGYLTFEAAVHDIDTEPMWSIDPFAFFQKALQASSFPVPDPTTENGRRILFIHIDGDGFIEKARFDQQKYAAEILEREILRKYPLPHSISVIEGEIGSKGLYPKLAPQMTKIARKIFAKPYVEMASHSYSHPFKWQKLSEGKSNNGHTYHLPIPGYGFDLKREIEGSIDYINRTLAPKNKKCTLFFWTGDCLPGEDALRLCENDHILAINGGDTTATVKNPWLGRIAPFGLQRGAFWQIYVGEQNENIYTNDWRGPFWGYRKVLETFAITNKPKRLKPINIYYHFYSTSRTASLNALKKIYEQVRKEKSIPLYTSEYIRIAHDFYNTSVQRTEDGFVIRNNGDLRTLRMPKSSTPPDILASKGVVGYKEEKGIRYIHLDTSGTYHLVLQTATQKFPYLIEANARVYRFEKAPNRFSLKLKSYQKLHAVFYLSKDWQIAKKRKLHILHHGNTVEITAAKNQTVEITFVRK